MLLRFTIENYRSIRSRVTLDLTRVGKFSRSNLPENLLATDGDDYDVLSSVIVYGANASGKSNLLNAIKALDELVNSSMDFKIDTQIRAYDPFRLNKEWKKLPSYFQVDFVAKNNVRYLYTVCINQKQILAEELYHYAGEDKSRKNLLFSRKLDKPIKFGSTYRGVRSFNIYPNQLILSQVAKEPNPILLPAFTFFSKHLFCSTLHDSMYDDSLIRQLTTLLDEEGSAFRRNINRLVRASDTAIREVITKEHAETEFHFPDDIPEEVKADVLKRFKKRVKAIHAVFDDTGKEIGFEEFDLSQESTGTIKLLAMGGLVIDALQDGSVLVIDELDKSLHSQLTKMLIGLFSDHSINVNRSQLLIASHDVTLLDKELFRFDQVIFTDKLNDGTSSYTRLSDYSGISKVADIASQYLLGRFGGTPMIDEYELDLEITPAG